MVDEGFGWIVDSTAILPCLWFGFLIADIARDSHSIGSLISSFIHQI